MREGYCNTINRFVCCLQSPIRSLGRLPLGLGSLNKIPCQHSLTLSLGAVGMEGSPMMMMMFTPEEIYL